MKAVTLRALNYSCQLTHLLVKAEKPKVILPCTLLTWCGLQSTYLIAYINLKLSLTFVSFFFFFFREKSGFRC